MANISHFTQTVNGVSVTYDIHDANAVPRDGGAVITGTSIAKTTNDSYATYCGGTNFDNGASVRVHGKDYSDPNYAGTILIRAKNNSDFSDLFLEPDGTATWGGKNLAMQEDIPTNTNQLTNGAGFITSAIKEGDFGNVRAGWCLLYGDLLIQWGSNTGSSNRFSVTFTKPFSRSPLVTVSYGDVSNYNTPCAIVEAPTTTNFEVAHSGSGGWRANWIAIGRKGY